MSRNVQRYVKKLNSVGSEILLVEIFKCIQKIKERSNWIQGHLNLLLWFCESELKIYWTINFCSLKIWYFWFVLEKSSQANVFGNDKLTAPLMDAPSETRSKLRVTWSTQLRLFCTLTLWRLTTYINLVPHS